MNEQQTMTHEAALFISKQLAELESSADETTYRELMIEGEDRGAWRWVDDEVTRARYFFELERVAPGRYQWRYDSYIPWRV